MSRAYYAAREYRTLLLQVVLILVLKIVVAAIAVKSLGMVGLGVSAAVSFNFGALVMVLVAGRRAQRLNGRTVVIYGLKIFVGATAMFAAAWPVRGLFLPGETSLFASCLRLALGLIVAGAVYGAAGYFLKYLRFPDGTTECSENR
jgi:peptidoglycan biosynthesis protein MviN/MurJ (putative lipid II flippase)